MDRVSENGCVPEHCPRLGGGAVVAGAEAEHGRGGFRARGPGTCCTGWKR